ncbi:MAG: protein-L-isoaspartate(D-aspartate) O-methyltransferase, partial [Desulfobacterales bacterium]|nr:protein-L-isoaspartate(D-aspartate) O-methyltransferase [Desulfobacterales bacterium]
MKVFGFIFILASSLIYALSACAEEDVSQDFKKLRNLMVTTQIEARGVKNKKILEAMRKVERHKFVPKEYIDAAYEDHPLPIGEGQTISQPYIVALMTEVLDPDGTKKVLEIGTGSGYQAAVLAELVQSVYTIEIIDVLGKRAEKILSDLGYKNVKVKTGDGYKGWKEHGPYDAIIVTCAPSHIPQPLKDQLAEGGRMVIPVGERYHQELILLTKEKGMIKQKEIIPVVFVPMFGGNGKKY